MPPLYDTSALAFSHGKSTQTATTVTVGCLLALAIALVARSQRIPTIDSAQAARNASAIATGVNPNTATASELSALPGIGPGRAGAIVAYREAHSVPTDPDELVFKCPEDLQAVSGIGPKTVQKLRNHLTFGN